MTDIIHLLPDAVSNQIAAGEVVQRPSSAVKELLENTIDAGATEVVLIIREAGKILIQVTDNGSGMSERDARMCFERHATSKIEKSDDLMHIRTFGFRGEALASIASIAQVELKTRRADDETGTCVEVEGSEFKAQFPVSCNKGTSISVKNLFFNVPARRNFLKSNTLELKYILEEFFRVALVNPHISFAFYNNDRIQYKLNPGNLKQRIGNLFGPTYGQKLIPVEEQTDLINISGYIGKPEFARKTRGEQYFFTNGRYMKSPYLHHAMETAFRELIPSDSHPSYFIYLEVDPQTIDVNIHPTKTEINFQDTKSIYAILLSTIRKSIGRFNLSPAIDFDVETGLDIKPVVPGQEVRQPVIHVNPDYNPFTRKQEQQARFNFPRNEKADVRGWEQLFTTGLHAQPPDLHSQGEQMEGNEHFPARPDDYSTGQELRNHYQVHNSFIVTHTRKGIIIIDQQHAHERVLYEKFLEETHPSGQQGQHKLFPQTISLSPDNAAIFHEWHDYFREIGFDIADFGNGSFVIHAFPFQIADADVIGFIESVIESLKAPGGEGRMEEKQKLARALAKKLSVKRGRTLQPEEMGALVENLFACKVPESSPDGKPVLIVMTFEELYKKFKIYS